MKLILKVLIPLARFFYLDSDFIAPAIFPSTIFNSKIYEDLLPHFTTALRSCNQFSKSTVTLQSLTNLCELLKLPQLIAMP
jgi:hypothetical protein